jgi:hypothetical protein
MNPSETLTTRIKLHKLLYDKHKMRILKWAMEMRRMTWVRTRKRTRK